MALNAAHRSGVTELLFVMEPVGDKLTMGVAVLSAETDEVPTRGIVLEKEWDGDVVGHTLLDPLVVALGDG